MSAESDLLTVTQAAAALKSSGQSVRNWIRAGELRAVRIGNRFLVPRSEVERMRGEVSAPAAESPWDYAAESPASPLVRPASPVGPRGESSEDLLGG
jgi:excisionase family DNA binding protein